ncbi:MAG: hypothetical protein KF691_10420 [Phycisphaeraceae bacterium]|nr:hypothetical protein [Phycisphaeraceae bacterium]
MLSRKMRSFIRGSSLAATLLLTVGGVYALTACTVRFPQAPGAPEVEVKWPEPGTKTPSPDTPGVTIPNPLNPGRTVTGYDTDGDGEIDLVYDPMTKSWYRIKKITPGGGTPAIAVGIGEGPVDYDGPHNDARPYYVLDGCRLSGAPLDWGAATAEDFIENLGLDAASSTTSTVTGLVQTHEFDSEGEADITVMWSTDQALVNPNDYSLCSAMYALPSTIAGAPAGMQIHVRGEWRSVSKWLLAMGFQRFSMPVEGVDWTLTAVPGQSAVDVAIGGIYVETISLN